MQDKIIEQLAEHLAEKKIARQLGDYVDFRELQNRLAVLFLSQGIDSILFFGGKSLGEKYGKKAGRLSLDAALEFFAKKQLELKNALIKFVKEKDRVIIKGYDCATCTGLSLGRNICFFEAGFISGFFSVATGKNYYAVETKCLANGNDCCEFEVKEVTLEKTFEAAFEF